MKRARLMAGGLVIAALVIVGGCKSDLANRVSSGREAVAAAAQTAMDELTAERDEKLRQLYETMGSLPGDDHPWRRWRIASANDDIGSRAETLTKAHEHSELADQFRDVATFLEAQKEYWTTPPGTGKLNRYMELLDQLIGRIKDKTHPFMAEMRFEREFLHADNYVRSEGYSPDTRLTSFYRFWKFAFGLKPKPREPFMTFIGRLCDERLQDYCKTLLWEQRADAMAKPYLEKLISNFETFRKDYPDSPYEGFIQDILKRYRAGVAEVGPFEEYPVLPSVRTTKDAVAADEIVIGERGVTWNGLVMAELPEGQKQLDEATLEAAVSGLDEKLGKMLAQLEEKYDKPEIELGILQAAKGTPMSQILAILGSPLRHRVAEFGFIARRRLDGTNRKVGTYLKLFYDPPPLDEELEARKTPEEREADRQGRMENDPLRKVPVEVAGMTCRGIGRVGELLAANAQPTSYLAVGPEKVSFGAVQKPESYVEDAASASEPEKQLTTADVLAKPGPLDEWANSRKGAVLVAVHTSFDYERFMQVLDRIVAECMDEACADMQQRPYQIYVAICE